MLLMPDNFLFFLIFSFHIIRLGQREKAEEHEFGLPYSLGLEGMKSVEVETRKAARLAGIVSYRRHRGVSCPLLACNCVHELRV